MSLWAVFLVCLIALSGLVSAELKIQNLEVNGHDPDVACADGSVCNSNIELYELNDELKIDVKAYAQNDDSKDITMFAYIAGYEYASNEKVSDSVPLFDLKENRTTWKSMTITLPQKLNKDEYDLRIVIAERGVKPMEYRFSLLLGPNNNMTEIKEIIFYPEKVVPGRALLITVKIKNNGEQEEEGVKITAAIPQLGVSSIDYVDLLDENSEITSQGLYLRIPVNAPLGKYEVDVTVEYNNRYYEINNQSIIEVVNITDFAEKQEEQKRIYLIEIAAVETESYQNTTSQTTIMGAYPDESQIVISGEPSRIYSLSISNLGKDAKTYSINVNESDLGSFTVTPTTFIVNPGEARAADVNLNVKENIQRGEYRFVISIKSGSEIIKEISLKVKIDLLCLQSGTRNQIDDFMLYCFEGIWQIQKENDQQCQNSFECKSNLCSELKCYDVIGKDKENRSLIQRILNWISNLFGNNHPI